MKIKFLVLFLLLPMLALAQFNPYQHNAFTTNNNNTCYQETIYTNSAGGAVVIFTPGGGSIGQGGVDPNNPYTSMFFNAGHPQEWEWQFGSVGSIAFSPGQDQNHDAVIQLGSAIATHDQIYIAPDDGIEGGVTIPDWVTNACPSKIISFDSVSNDINGSKVFAFSGMRGEPSGQLSQSIVYYNPQTWLPRVQPVSRSAGTPQMEVNNNGINVDSALSIGSPLGTAILDTVVSNFIAAAVTNLSAREIIGLNNFVVAAKAKGYYSKLQSFNPMRGGTAASVVWNLINTNTFKMSISGPAFYTNGITVDSQNGHVDTGINPITSFSSLSNQMYFCWVNNTAPPNNYGFIGSFSGGGWAGLYNQNAAAVMNVQSINTHYDLQTAAYPNGVGPSGFMSISMTNTLVESIWANSKLVGHLNAASFSTGDTANLLLGDSSAGSSTVQVSFSFCGCATNFTDSDTTNLVNDLTALRNTFNAPSLGINGDSSITGFSTAGNGFISYSSNKLAAVSVSLSGSPCFWTNTTLRNAQVGFVGGTVTGVSVNGSFWATALGGGHFILQPNEWIGFTNSGVPTFTYKPF